MTELLIALFLFFNIFYLISLLKKDFSIVDTAWGLSFFLIFFMGLFSANFEYSYRDLIIGILVFIWAIRLSGYIFYRSLKIEGEDYRYAQWRKEWGKNANAKAYFKVFILQAILSLLASYPLFLIHHHHTEKEFGTFLDIIGLFLWLIGFFFEAVGDYQKHKFKSNKDNTGKILNSGLWGLTRHPNYFGEVLLWWGVFLIVCNEVPFYLVIWAPIFLSLLIIKISGVALLEKKYLNNSDYEQYQKRVNAFFPWFPKKIK